MDHPLKTFLFFLLILSLCCVLPVSAEYATFHADNARTGFVEETLTISHNDNEYYTHDGIKYAISKRTGSSNPNNYNVFNTLANADVNDKSLAPYTTKHDGYIAGSPAVNNKKIVYYGTLPEDSSDTNAGVYAYDMKKSTNDNPVFLWNYSVPKGSASGITLAKEYLYFGGADGKLYRLDEAVSQDQLDPKSTDVLDTTNVIGLSSTPLVFNDVVYVTSQTPAKLWAFNAATLDPVFNISLEYQKSSRVANFSSPATDGTFIYTSGGPGIVAVDPESSIIVAVYPADGPTGTPVCANGMVYFTTNSTLYAAPAATEENKTTAQTTQEPVEIANTWLWQSRFIPSAPAVTDSRIIVSGTNTSPYSGLTAFDLDGTIVWTHASGDSIPDDYTGNPVIPSSNSPLITGDLVWYTFNLQKTSTNYGMLIALNISDGKEPTEEPYGSLKYRKGYTFTPSGSPVIYPYRSAGQQNAYITTSSPVFSDNVIYVGAASLPGSSGVRKNALLGFGQRSSVTTLFNGGITLPTQYTISTAGSANGVPYCTLLGAVHSSAEAKGSTYTISTDSGLTEFFGITAAANNNWYISKNGGVIQPATLQNLSQTVQSGDRIELVYSTEGILSGDRTDVTYNAKITVTTSDNTGTISFSDVYQQLFTKDETTSYTITPVVTTWDGKAVDNAQISWTASGKACIQGSSTGPSVTYTMSGNIGDTGTLSASYTPPGGNASTTKTWTSETLTIVEYLPIPDDTDATSDTYTTWKGNNARTGDLATTGPQTNDILWTADFLGKGSKYVPLIDGGPVIDGEYVYFSSWAGGMGDTGTSVDGLYKYRLDGTYDDTCWRAPELSGRGGFTVRNGKIYGGTTGGGTLVCIDAESGKMCWSTETISDYAFTGLTCTPLVTEKDGSTYIYAITSSGDSKGTTNYLYVYRDDGTSATEIKNISAGITADGKNGGTGMFASCSMSPDGTIYVPGAGGVIAIDPANDHKVKWVFDANARGQQGTSNDVYVGTPVYRNQSIYVATNGNLYCLNAVTGEKTWHVQHPAIRPATPVVTEDKVIAAGYVKNDIVTGIAAYSVENGALLWHYDKGETNRASPIVAGNILYFGTYSDQTLYAVNADDGTEIWTYKLPGVSDGEYGGGNAWFSLIETTPAVYKGILYVGAEDGKFYAFGPNDKTPFNITGTKTVDTGVEASFTTDTGRAYSWNFGDGTKTTGTASSVKKIWKTAGTYTVTASSGTKTATFIVTVTTPPKAFSESEAHRDPSSVKQATITVNPAQTLPPGQTPSQGVTTTPGTNVSLTFSTKVLDSTTGTAAPVVEVVEYQAVTTPDAAVKLDEQKYTKPPNTEKTIFLMNVSAVQNVQQKETEQGHRLDVMAKLVVNLTVTKDTAKIVSFWRYIDNNTDPVPLKSFWWNIPEDEGAIVVTYTIYVPGFSTIVATVDETAAQVIEPPKETTGGGGGSSSSGSSYSGFSFTSINPGTGTVTYTTNHPDWPATTFTINRMTALGVLLASGKSVVSAERWGGVYIHSINGLSPASDSEGWMYQVNGISPGAMANNYPVSNGDKVVWYYSEDMTKPVSASKQVYAFTVSTSTAVSEITGGSTTAQPGQTTQTTATTVKPAETNRVIVGIPDGINVEKLEIGQKITIDTAVTKLTGTVNVNSRSIVIIQPGIQITIPLADVVYNGDVATATIRGMTAEIVPAPVTVPKGGYAV